MRKTDVNKHLPVMEDYVRINYVGDPVCNAGARLVAWTGSYWDTEPPLAMRRFRERIHVAKIKDRAICEETIITAGGVAENCPHILSGGAVLFLSDAGMAELPEHGTMEQRLINEYYIAPQLYLYHDGAAKKLTHMLHGVCGYSVSPDEKRLLFTSWKYDGDTAEAMLCERTAEESASLAAKAAAELIICEAQSYKADAEYGYRSKRKQTLWLLDIASGGAKCLLDENSDFSAPCWLDASRVLFESTNDEGKLVFSTIDVSADEAKTETLAVIANVAMCLDDDCAAALSPDGETLIFAGNEPGAEYADPRGLYSIPVAGGIDITAARLVDKNADIDGILPQDMNFSSRGDIESEYVLHEDGYCYYATALDGDVRIAKVEIKGKDAEPVYITGGMANFHALSAFDANTLLALYGAPDNTVELALVDTKTGAVTVLTNSNPWIKDIELTKPEKVHTSTGIQGFYLPPRKPDSGRKAPLILYCHGGPTGFYCSALNYEYQALSAAGFGVLYGNPRGSTGFGAKNSRDAFAYDGTGMNDLILLVDEVCLNHAELDHESVGICGGSYGGYMTLWSASHSTRFKAASAMRPLANMQMISASSHSAGGNTREEYAEYIKKLLEDIELSPTSYIDKIKIPLQIQQSELDANCVPEQARQAFAAMRELNGGVPCRLALYPDSNHGILYRGPVELATLSRNDNLAWFKKHL